MRKFKTRPVQSVIEAYLFFQNIDILSLPKGRAVLFIQQNCHWKRNNWNIRESTELYNNKTLKNDIRFENHKIIYVSILIIRVFMKKMTNGCRLFRSIKQFGELYILINYFEHVGQWEFQNCIKMVDTIFRKC